jgi:hypothetical protein
MSSDPPAVSLPSIDGCRRAGCCIRSITCSGLSFGSCDSSVAAAAPTRAVARQTSGSFQCSIVPNETLFMSSPGASILTTVCESPRGSSDPYPAFPREPLEDPVLIAEWAELTTRLGEALARLAPRQRWIVAQWTDGRSLRDIAAELGEPYHHVKREWRTILCRLAAALSDWQQ